jgi:hypothetical protein
MSREVVFLHTIEQWLAYPPPLRATILQSIKLKDRLNRYLLANSNREPLPPEGKWDACKKCSTKGWVLKKPRLPGLHPSQIPNPCLLKIYWEMKGKPEQSKHKPDSLLTFDIGHAVHDMLQGYGRGGAWGPMYEAEVTLSPQKQPIAAELMIQGSADAENILVIDDIPNAPIYEVGLVHEYKTIKKENYDKLIRPKPEHKQQATIYGGVLNRPVVVYLYICKNDSRVTTPSSSTQTCGRRSMRRQLSSSATSTAVRSQQRSLGMAAHSVHTRTRSKMVVAKLTMIFAIESGGRHEGSAW